MSRTLTTLILTIVFLTTCSLTADAQKGQRGNREGRGQFTVAAGEEAVILVDQKTGKSWYLEHPSEPGASPLWLPVERIDDSEAANEWRHDQLVIERERDERERDERQAQFDHRQHEHKEMMERNQREMQQQIEKQVQQRQEQTGNAELDRLQQRLKSYALVLKRMKDAEGKEHPTYRKIQKRMEEVEREIEEINETPINLNSSVSPDLGHAGKNYEQELLRLRNLLTESTQRRDELREKYGDQHPQVRKLESDLQRIEQKLEATLGMKDDLRRHVDRLAADMRELTAKLELARQEEHNDAELQRLKKLFVATQQKREERLKELYELQQYSWKTDDRQSQAAEHPQAELLHGLVDQLLPLQVEEAILLQTHGNEHPKVIEIRKRIELILKHINEQAGRDEATAGTDSDPKHAIFERMAAELFPLLTEKELLQQSYGPEHPKVRAIEKRIEMTRDFFKEQAEPPQQKPAAKVIPLLHTRPERDQAVAPQ